MNHTMPTNPGANLIKDLPTDLFRTLAEQVDNKTLLNLALLSRGSHHALKRELEVREIRSMVTKLAREGLVTKSLRRSPLWGDAVNPAPGFPHQPYVTAVDTSHFTTASWLIKNGCRSFRRSDPRGNPPIVQVASRAPSSQHLEAKKQLILDLMNHGEGINQKNHLGKTAIFFSTFFQDRQLTEFLIDNGADLTIQDHHGETILHQLARPHAPDPQSLAWLKNLAPGNLRVKNRDGDLPLHIAMKSGHEATAAVLVDGIFGVEEPNNRGQLPLHCALSSHLYLETFPQIMISSALNHQDHQGVSPAHLACWNRCGQQIASLADRSANFNLQDSIGRTPLHYFLNSLSPYNVTAQSAHVLVNLMEVPNLDLNVVDGAGMTALHMAQHNGLVMFYDLLLEYGANPNIRDHEGRLPERPTQPQNPGPFGFLP